MSTPREKNSILRQVAASLGWTRHSYYLLSGFILLCGLIVYAWWPLAEEALAYIDWSGPWWRYFDWLLVGIWLVMSLLIMSGADLRKDAWIVAVGLVGGLVIESWGTQTEIWWYYTAERPPLWIIPAWPIASLSIDRLVRLLRRWLPGEDLLQNTQRVPRKNKENSANSAVSAVNKILYWIVFLAFYALMFSFVWPTLDKSFTILALILVALLILTPTDYRLALLTFAAGSALGYFLELWGTTRECWTYYTLATPPVFAVFAHGMAALAFWRTMLLLQGMIRWGIRNSEIRQP
ncbi:MAG TPA: hypothetical protein DEH22_06665 [Chloroflexi bacterium]|nr:hypothetical protein [Chloroflexota bacterium]